VTQPLPTPRHRRRAVLGSLTAAAFGGPFLLRDLAQRPPHAHRDQGGRLRVPDGRAAVEPVPDRRSAQRVRRRRGRREELHPEVTQIFVSGDTYRFNMHTVDRDGNDRQRQEVRGMGSNDSVLNWRSGEQWRITFDLFVSNNLRGTTSFTHIFQL
jgi:hypothetical protein